MRKIYRLCLESEERQALEAICRKGKTSGPKVIKARALLLANESEEGAGWPDSKIMESTGIRSATLARLRQRCCEVGPLEALERKKQASPSRCKLLDGDGEAQLIAIACSEPPKGFARWTLYLISERLVELKVVESISHETVRKTLKKSGLSLG